MPEAQSRQRVGRLDLALADAFASTAAVTGEVARVTIRKGDLIVPTLLAHRPASAFQMSITPGMRAYSVLIRSPAVLPFMVGPNSRVDVLAFVRGRSGDRTATLLIQDVRVLVIGQRLRPQPDSGGPSVFLATLELYPVDVARLATAAARDESVCFLTLA